MKTIHLTTLSSAHVEESFNQFRRALSLRHPKLPQPAYERAALDHLTYTALLGKGLGEVFVDKGDIGYGFYESSLDRPLNFSDPVGTYSVRIDYDPNWTEADGEEEPMVAPSDPAELFGSLLLAVEGQFEYDTNPSNTYIDHYRLSAVIAPGVIVTRTLWPVFEADFKTFVTGE